MGQALTRVMQYLEAQSPPLAVTLLASKHPRHFKQIGRVPPTSRLRISLEVHRLVHAL